MSLIDFINYNKKCPVCGEPLTLYMQWTKSVCFRATATRTPGMYQFDPFKCLNDDECWSSFMVLVTDKNSYKTIFSSSRLANESKKYKIYFFYLCNPIGFRDKDKVADYTIDLYKGCYYRSTPFMEFMRNDISEGKRWTLEYSDPEHKSLINKDESCCIKKVSCDLEKVYMLNMDYQEKETSLWYYAVTPEQKKSDDYYPNIFEKKLPLLKSMPKLGLEHQDKLAERLDSWIIMS